MSATSLEHPLLLHLRIGTRHGVRIEILPMPFLATEFQGMDTVLHHENGFQHERVRVRMWQAPERCRIREVSASRFCNGCFQDMNHGGYEGGDEEISHAPPRAKKRCARLSACGKRARTEPIGKDSPPLCFWELDMTDERTEDVGYIWLLPMLPKPRGSLGSQEDAPHAAHDFHIENACGACILGEPLDMEALRPFLISPIVTRAKRGVRPIATGELITTLSGTFAPCTNRMQVDFRGVRSITEMMADWTLIQRGVAPERVQLYMIVLKANLGLPVQLVDTASMPPGLTGTSERIAMEGWRLCFLATLMMNWCLDFDQCTDVCMALQFQGIDWKALFPQDLCEPLRRVRSTSVHVSRRGGVMMRLIFPSDTPWGPAQEAAVVDDSNRLLGVMRKLLAGKSAF